MAATRMCQLALLSLLLAPSLASAWSLDGWGQPRSRAETNAAQFSRGLPPLPPRRLFTPSRVGAAMARRSVTPVTNTLLVSGVNPATSTTVTCYMASDAICVPTQANAVVFQASVGAGSPDPQDIIMTTYAGYSLVALSPTPTLSLTDPSTYAQIGPAAGFSTSPNAGPSFDGGSGYYYETAIWYVNSQGVLSASWVNPNGDGSVPLTLALGTAGSNYIFLATADPTQFTNEGPGSAFPVTITFG
ncbi:hypothetical protein CALCODRAFT_503893 [Calocera cornea HHB12733]|uniref:Uncharacterized protein n=1 Tax=Calocera cornea HHB12733 TaxID=1353952 RepID=A0A165CPI5_9BASI|nr:hypothetical protein CALCODRAFT_503893 [Calocera cornea HHB12733]